MHPYRENNNFKPWQPPGKTLFGKIRTFYRKLLIKSKGKFLKRFNIKCPNCGVRSWDPHDYDEKWKDFIKTCVELEPKSSYYRCGYAINPPRPLMLHNPKRPIMPPSPKIIHE